jgi:hypothetical protein
MKAYKTFMLLFLFSTTGSLLSQSLRDTNIVNGWKSVPSPITIIDSSKTGSSLGNGYQDFICDGIINNILPYGEVHMGA